MVSLSLKECATPTANDNAEGHLIKLDANQASNVPFPPGCPVLVLDNKGNITTSGLVTAVFVSFIRNTGSCTNCYSVASKDTDGSVRSQIVGGALLRYGINCTIKVSPRGDQTIHDEEAIDGVIKGFEVQNENGESTDSTGGNAPLFVYSVEVCAAGSSPDEPVTFRQRGISPEHIRFRQPNESELDAFGYSYHPDNEKSSLVSLDDATQDTDMNVHNNKGKVQGPIQGNFLSPMKSPIRRNSSIGGMCNTDLKDIASSSSHPHLVCETDCRAPGQKQSPSSNDKMTYSKCTPLPPPHPTHFCGDVEKAQNERVPDFSYLANFPHNNMLSLPFGTKRCVMCGEVRSCNVGKSAKTKSMKASQVQNKDAVVIPNQNKGLCTVCDVNIWVVKDSKQQIKWCKGCKNFQPWALFGEKGGSTKCVKCRERQRKKYAASKNKQIANANPDLNVSDGTALAGGKRKLTAVDNERVVKRA